MKTYLMASAFTLLTLPVHAATYSYSFSNVYGDINGDVSGTIELADGDGTFAATSVIIETLPIALGLGSGPISVSTSSTFENSFIVLGGNVVSASFLGLINSGTALGLNSSLASGITFLDQDGIADFGESGVQDPFSTTLTFAPVATAAVPLPAGVFLLGGALFGLGSIRRKVA